MITHFQISFAVRLSSKFVIVIFTYRTTSKTCHYVWNIYRVTRIIVNNFEGENLYVVNFINRQTFIHSIGMINKIIWRKYYTDSCSASVIILSSVATLKNCTIMRWQHYFKTVRRLNISRPVSVLFLMTAFSLSGIKPMRFCTVVKEIDLQDATKYEDPMPIRSWVMRYNVSHWLPLKMRTRPLRRPISYTS